MKRAKYLRATAPVTAKQTIPATQTPEFKAWFRGSKVVNPDGSPKIVYHGSTHEFDRFDPSKGDKEGHYGAALYFTDGPQDVNLNYATPEGPDLQNRVGRRVEELENDLQDNWGDPGVELPVDLSGFDRDEPFPRYGTPDYKRLHDLVIAQAQKELVGKNQGSVYLTFLRMERPVVVKPSGGTCFDGGSYDQDDEWKESRVMSRLERSFRAAADQFGAWNSDDLWGEVMSHLDALEGFTAWEFEQAVRSNLEDDGIMDAGGPGPLLGRTYQLMGFDGVILDASAAFPHMKSTGSATHYMVWKPTQVKSALGNSGSYNSRSPRINASIEHDIVNEDGSRVVTMTLKGVRGPSFRIEAIPTANGGIHGDVHVITDLGRRNHGLPPFRVEAENEGNQLATAQAFAHGVWAVLQQEYQVALDRATEAQDRALCQAITQEYRTRRQEVLGDILDSFTKAPEPKLHGKLSSAKTASPQQDQATDLIRFLRSTGRKFRVNEAGTGTVYVEVATPQGPFKVRFADHPAPSYSDPRFTRARAHDMSIDPSTSYTFQDAVDFISNATAWKVRTASAAKTASAWKQAAEDLGVDSPALDRFYEIAAEAMRGGTKTFNQFVTKLRVGLGGDFSPFLKSLGGYTGLRPVWDAVVEDDADDLIQSIEGARISPRKPTAKGKKNGPAIEDPHGKERLQPNLEVMSRDEQVLAHNVALMEQYPGFQRFATAGSPADQAEAMINHMKDNLIWLFKNWHPSLRERSRFWYVGGNRLIHRWAKRFGLDPHKIAAVVAALSPQQHWFQNMTLAERVISALKEHADQPWDEKMTERMLSRDWGNKGAGKEPSPASILPELEGKTLNDLKVESSLYKQAVWIRAWDEAHNPNMCREITPEGEFGDWYMTKDGSRPVANRWQSFSAVIKAIQALDSTSMRDISDLVGDNHKVRSFYNNLIAPKSQGEDVTVDTHAVAAALLRPLAQSNREVAHNFGSGLVGETGPKNSSITGATGLYSFYAEAYRRAAHEVGVQPREMQSITWEAVRGLFRPEQKGKQNQDLVEKSWNNFGTGRINADTARAQILEHAGGIETPTWARPHSGGDEIPRDSSYAGELYRDGASGGGPDGLSGGTGNGTSGRAASVEGSRAKFLRPKAAGGYEEETEAIRERSKSPEAQKAHKFQASEWTLPNGHPRCRVCGDEEPEGGECSGATARKTASSITLHGFHGTDAAVTGHLQPSESGTLVDHGAMHGNTGYRRVYNEVMPRLTGEGKTSKFLQPGDTKLLTKCAAPSWDTLYTALAKSFPTAEAFSKAYSLGGARPRAWHLSSSEQFSVDSAHHPEDGGMGGSGGRTPEPSLFVTTDPAYWGPRGSGYLSGRAYVFEIDLTGLTFGADYHADARGMEGLVLSASGMQKARNLGAIPLASALRRAKAQQAAGPQSREELDALFARAHSVKQASEKIEDGTYSMPLDEAIEEHVKLVDALKSPSHTDDLEEAKEQGKELKEMQEAKKTAAASGSSQLIGPVYHGTSAEFGEFEVGREAKNYMWGREITESRLGLFFAADKSVAQTFGPRVLCCFIKFKRMADLTEGFPLDLWATHAKMLQDNNIAGTSAESMWELFDSGMPGAVEFVSALKGLGYDGARITEGGSDVYVVFDPKQVRIQKTSKFLQPKTAATLKDGRSIRITRTKWHLDKGRFSQWADDPTKVWLIRAFLDDKVIGHADFYEDWGTVEDVKVDAGFRRLGVATAIYNAIERAWGIKLRPSDHLEPDGEAFWKDRKRRVSKFLQPKTASPRKTVFHATDAQFDAFRDDTLSWFTEDRDDAIDYGGSRVIEARITVDKPANLDSPRVKALLEQALPEVMDDGEVNLFAFTEGGPKVRRILQAAGFDGAVVTRPDLRTKHWAVFHPGQVQILQPKTAATLQISPKDIGLMTLDEYLKHQNAGDTRHPDESYDWPVEKMNQDYSKHWIGDDPSNRYSCYRHAGGYTVTSVADKDLVGVSDGSTLWLLYPLTSLPRDYWINGQRTLAEFGEVTQVKYPAEYLTRVFDPTKHSLEKYPVLLQTLQDYQIRAEADPTKKQGTSLAVVHKGLVVAQAQDEWGATLIAVAQEYRGHGLGTLIARYWAMYNPDYTSGGFTYAGQQTAIKAWSNRVRELLSHGVYSDLVAKGEITQERVAAITEKLRGRDQGISPPGQTGTPDTGKMLVYTDDIQFVLYDSAFLQDQDESHIKGFGFMRDSSPHAGSFFYRLDYDPKFKEVATAVALQMAKDQDTPLYMGKGYRDLMDVTGFPVRKEGDSIILTQNVLNLRQLKTRERSLRRQADPHQEMEYSLIEAAHQKNWGQTAKASSVAFKQAARGITLHNADDVTDFLDECIDRLITHDDVVQVDFVGANDSRVGIIMSPDPRDPEQMSFAESKDGKFRMTYHSKARVTGAPVARNLEKVMGEGVYPLAVQFRVHPLNILPPKMTAQQIAAGELDTALGVIKDSMKRLWALRVWATTHYDAIGRPGSSRIAFKLDKDHAIKVALNSAGVAQNLTESHVAQHVHAIPITQVHYMGLGGAILVVDYAHELNEVHFARDFGVSFEDFCVAINDCHAEPDYAPTILKNLPSATRNLLAEVQKLHLSTLDLRYPEQWGDVAGHSVLLDYGLTHEVWRDHYKRSKLLRR